MGQCTESAENEVTLALPKGFVHLSEPLVVASPTTRVLVVAALESLHRILMTGALAKNSPLVQRDVRRLFIDAQVKLGGVLQDVRVVVLVHDLIAELLLALKDLQ